MQGLDLDQLTPVFVSANASLSFLLAIVFASLGRVLGISAFATIAAGWMLNAAGLADGLLPYPHGGWYSVLISSAGASLVFTGSYWGLHSRVGDGTDLTIIHVWLPVAVSIIAVGSAVSSLVILPAGNMLPDLVISMLFVTAYSVLGLVMHRVEVESPDWRPRFGLASSSAFGMALLALLGLGGAAVMPVGVSIGLGLRTTMVFGAAYFIVQVAQELGASARERRLAERLLHELGTAIPLLELQTRDLLEHELPQRLRVPAARIHHTAVRALAILGAARSWAAHVDDVHAGGLALPESDLTADRVVHVNAVIEASRMAVQETRPESVRFRAHYTSRCCVRVPRGALDQVLVNLLRNAFDAFPDGKGVVWLRTRHVEYRGIAMVEITVADNGEGLSESPKVLLREGFSTRGTVRDGRGFGLSLASSIIERQGGDLTFVDPRGNSLTGAVTAVQIRLPRVPCRPDKGYE